MFQVPRTGGWVEEGGVGHQDPRCPGKFLKGLGSTPQADSLRFEESYPYSKLGLEDSRLGLTALAYPIISLWVYPFWSPLIYLVLPQRLFPSTFVQTPFTAQHNVCGESEISLYLQANKLACHCFTDTGARQETPGSKIKDVIVHNTEGGISFTFSWVLLALKPKRGNARWLNGMLHTHWVCIIAEEPCSLRNIISSLFLKVLPEHLPKLCSRGRQFITLVRK